MGLLLLLLAAACKKGDIYTADSIRNRGTWFEPTPFGMVYVQRSHLLLGPSDDEMNDDSRMVSVSVDAFWMDDTEITNNEYRQFTEWVRDSIARTLLGSSDPDFLKTENVRGEPLP